MRQLIMREDLYNLVWTKPITKIAKDYDVSDSAIIKICKKMEVPRPGMGYWAKVEHGKKVKVKPLGKLTKKGVDRHYLWKQGYLEGQLDEKGNSNPLIEMESKPENLIIVLESLEDAHKLTTMNIKRFKNAKADERGILHPRSAQHLDLQITRGTEDRALRIMDALLKAFDKRGWQFEVSAEAKHRMVVVVQDEDIPLSLQETVRAVEHVETDKEKRARATGRWFYPPRYDYVQTGRLKLSMETFYRYSGRSSWGDGKIQRVESCLNKFCAGLAQYSEATKQKIVKDEKARIMRELKYSGQRRQQEKMEYEMSMRKQLVEQTKSWQTAKGIRAFVDASSAQVREDVSILESHHKWVEWALGYADSIDPLLGGTPSVEEVPLQHRSYSRGW